MLLVVSDVVRVNNIKRVDHTLFVHDLYMIVHLIEIVLESESSGGVSWDWSWRRLVKSLHRPKYC
jgi:hypothetical protein